MQITQMPTEMPISGDELRDDVGKDTVDFLDKYSEEDLYSVILRCGMYYGAFFQSMCVVASFLLPLLDKRITGGLKNYLASLTSSNQESNNAPVNNNCCINIKSKDIS